MSFYFASNRSKANPNNTNITLLSRKQEKELAKKERSLKRRSAAAGAVETEPFGIIDNRPSGSRVEEFYSRPIHHDFNSINSNTARSRQRRRISEEEMFERNQKEMVACPASDHLDPPIGSLLIERKVPIKLEPKVFLAVERTFLLWMHSAMWLLAAAMTIISAAYEDPRRLMYGIIILPVALAFICYSLFQYIRRVSLLRRLSPGPYEDLAGPTVLSICLMVAIVAQFGMQLYDMM